MRVCLFLHTKRADCGEKLFGGCAGGGGLITLDSTVHEFKIMLSCSSRYETTRRDRRRNNDRTEEHNANGGESRAVGWHSLVVPASCLLAVSCLLSLQSLSPFKSSIQIINPQFQEWRVFLDAERMVLIR